MIIDPAIYTDQRIFDEEMKRFFHERYFVGTLADFPEVDCYRSFRIGNKTITVRRTSDGIRAFNNVCLHRSSIIDPLGSGKRSFRCKYHGWRYDANGKLSHTPFTSIDQVARCQLESYPVSTVAGRIFVGLNGNSPNLDKVPGVLAKCGLSDIPATPFYSGSTLIKCNWKQLFESVAENYHLNFVHSNSFSQESYQTTGVFHWDSDEYIFSHEMKPTELTKKKKGIEDFIANYEKKFVHVYIFPNLFIANTENLIGFHNRLIPISPSETLTEWSLYELPNMQVASPGVRALLRDNALNFSITAQSEDKTVIESCGDGISQHGASVQLQAIEGQLQKFHEFYQKEMSDVF